MKRLVLLVAVVFMFVLSSCTENARVKTFGGTGSETVEKGQKVVTVTWKGDELWILTRPMKPSDTAETYKFQEKSSFGVMEGTFIIKEQK